MTRKNCRLSQQDKVKGLFCKKEITIYVSVWQRERKCGVLTSFARIQMTYMCFHSWLKEVAVHQTALNVNLLKIYVFRLLMWFISSSVPRHFRNDVIRWVSMLLSSFSKDWRENLVFAKSVLWHLCVSALFRFLSQPA